MGIVTAVWMMGAGQAIAQSSSTTTVERTFVTGTNIRRVDVETPAPVQIIYREEIERSGLTSIADIVHLLPANNNGTIADAFTNGFAAGASGVSLRGLGVTSTLVLLNGRRLAPYGLADDGQRAFIDLNQIPFEAVERIEVLKDGASAIYGSDAIAGVVNVILRREFQGFTANASYGTSYKTDGDTVRGSAGFGFGELGKDKYNVFFLVDAFKQDDIKLTDRREYIGNSDLRFMGLPDARGGNPNNPFRLSTNSPLGNFQSVNPATGGSPGPYVSGPGPCADGFDAGYCTWDIKRWRDVQPETQRVNVMAKGTYQFTNELEAYAEASYSNSQADTRNTPTPLRSTWANVRDNRVVTSNNVFLPVGHPDNLFNAEGRGARPSYTFFDFGGRNGSFDTDTSRFVGGLRGTHGGWDWDIGALYTRSETESVRHGFIRYSAFQQALAGTSPFGYYRFGGNAPLNDPGIYDYLSPDLVRNTESSVTSIDGKATRDLMQLPGGPLGLALGAEWRREKLDNPGDPFTFEGDIIGLGYSSANAERDVAAVHAELNAPVHPTVELNVALRYDHYDDYGSSTTPKFGLRWTPTREVLLRGTYSEGFRAPGPYESGFSTTAGFTTYVDPVRCPVTRLPEDCGQRQAIAITGGNPDLEPEESKSWTLGIVWEPVQNLSVGVDYWNIERTKEITATVPQAVLNNPLGFPAARIVREADDDLPGIPNSGKVSAVVAPYENANKVKTDGIDIDVRYQWSIADVGRFTANAVFTRVFSFERTLSDGLPLEYAGTHGPTELSSSAGSPQNRGVFSLGWERGPWTVTAWVRYTGGMKDIEFQGDENGCLHIDFNTACEISSFTTVDVTASYKGFKNWEIYGSVNNIFDRLAPLDFQAGVTTPFYNFNYAQAGAIGTFFTVGARYSFK